jgi:CRISPR/Cas system-associated exonuclease Cas4 (RecB family)
MDSRREKSYVWVTWITGLLACSQECAWRSWYRAHFRYAKREDDGPELEKWIRDHDEMVAARGAALRERGCEVRVEDEVAFKLEGKLAVLAGKPDILAIRRDKRRAIVIDAKSGKRRARDFWQVLVYLFALPLAFPELRDCELEGELEYRGERVRVPKPERQDRDRIVEVMRLVGGEDEPERSPSVSECRFCDVRNCPERVMAEVAVVEVAEW